MTKKKDTTFQDWSKVITEMGERDKEIDNMLTPSKGEIRYIIDNARSILEKATHIEMACLLAHEKVITFEQAQKIMDWQKEQLQRDIKHIQMYLNK
jgi:hypothetical protein